MDGIAYEAPAKKKRRQEDRKVCQMLLFALVLSGERNERAIWHVHTQRRERIMHIGMQSRTHTQTHLLGEEEVLHLFGIGDDGTLVFISTLLPLEEENQAIHGPVRCLCVRKEERIEQKKRCQYQNKARWHLAAFLVRGEPSQILSECGKKTAAA